MDAVDLGGLLAPALSQAVRRPFPLGAEATSLVAIVLVSVVGIWRQRRSGHVHLRDGLLVGALSPSAYWWVLRSPTRCPTGCSR